MANAESRNLGLAVTGQPPAPVQVGCRIAPDADATDAPPRPLADAIGRLLYLLHLAVLLWWLLDKSPGQRATHALVTLVGRMLPSAALTLRLPPVRRFVQSADRLFQEALLEEPS